MPETSIVLSSASLITIFGFWKFLMKIQEQAKENGANEALIEKRLADLESVLEKNKKDISDLKSTLYEIDVATQVVLSKLESDKTK